MLIRRGRRSEETRAAALAKEREMRRKKMLRTKYGQKPLKHAKKGVHSCVYAGVSAFWLLLMINLSFVKKGEIGTICGIAGFVILWASFAGLRSGIRGLNERDKNYITCKVGIAVNGLILLGIVSIFVRGLF